MSRTGKHRNKTTIDYGDVTTPEGRAAAEAKYQAQLAWETYKYNALLETPAYKAFAEREAAASGYNLKQLKQQADLNAANISSSEKIAKARNRTELQIAQMNSANDQQKTALQAAQVAADLSSRPADYFQAANFYANANHMSQVPTWLTGMIGGNPQFAYVPPGTGASGIVGAPMAVAASPTTPNADVNGNTVMAPAVAGDTSNGTTGTGTPAPIAGIANAQTVASTAPVNGTLVPTLDPNGSQAGSLAYTSQLLNGQAVPQGMASLGTIDQIARNPNKIAPGSLEGLSSTQRDLLYSGLGRQGYDVPSFLKSYGSFAINQGQNAQAY